MSCYPRSHFNNEQSSLPPILRLIDEYDQYSRSTDRSDRSQPKTFTPKFDVKELQDSYELFGELPGIQQKDIDLEFTDGSTLTVKGHTKRIHSHDNTEDRPKKSLKATVEDEEAEDQSASVSTKNLDTKGEAYEKFWVTERNVGHFSRSFTFPDRVDQDNVTASLKIGILSITVPKAKKMGGRRIAIQ